MEQLLQNKILQSLGLQSNLVCLATTLLLLTLVIQEPWK